MAILTPLEFLDPQQARLYQDTVELLRPAQIFTINMASLEKIDIVCDDIGVGIYYYDPVGLYSEFLYIDLPCRANRYMVRGIWEYLNSPYNWPHFVDRSWRQWKGYFLDVGFRES